jgi:hypothetical protein
VSERSRLRNRSLVALLTAEGVSSLGSQITFLALPWFFLALRRGAGQPEAAPAVSPES